MARTRGGSLVQKRQRLIEDIRTHVDAQVPVVDYQEETQEILIDAHVNPQIGGSFLGGPADLSVLKNFSYHVATRLWIGEDRGELKIVNHGRKVKDFSIKHQQIQRVVEKFGLASLLHCNYNMLDKGLVSAFVERWQPETKSFHLPIGEMTITLDDVSCLLHLPIKGALYNQPIIDSNIACLYLKDLLGVSHKDAVLEMNATRGLRVRMRWLQDVYDVRCQEKRWDFASRAFLLFLVGCTIFADKSASYVDIVFLDLFRDLSACSDYAWGVAALTFLYKHLDDTCVHDTKQIGGYMTLLQAWVFEHFPRIGSRQLSIEYTEQNPRIGHVSPFRIELDTITVDDVSWIPYHNHRVHRPFDDIALYSGWLRWGSCKQPHLPERVLWQYGYIQGIPRSPQEVTNVVISLEDIDDRWLQYADYVVDVATSGPRVVHAANCSDGYMQWFLRISHPFIIPPKEKESIKMSWTQHFTIPHSSTSDPHHVMERCARCDRISDILQMILDKRMVAKDIEFWDLIKQALNIASAGNEL